MKVLAHTKCKELFSFITAKRSPSIVTFDDVDLPLEGIKHK